MKELPRLVYADEAGKIYDEPRLLMLCRKGFDITLPRPDELIPLPKDSDIFFLPQKRPLGFDKKNGKIEVIEDRYAVAAFVSPGYTLTGLCAYKSDSGSSVLPLFAYGAVGFLKGRFWVCAKKVDNDPRQIFSNIKDVENKIKIGVDKWFDEYPNNRLFAHLAKCALKYRCPAAKNLALGRYEAPLPTSPTCNARCLGCISKQPKDSGFPSTQERIDFIPSPIEISEVMLYHSKREKRPILSFGQGCEGEPLLQYETIKKAIEIYIKEHKGPHTININTNGSLPVAIYELAKAGLNSIRVSMNSADEKKYMAYYRPISYSFKDVQKSIEVAKEEGLFVSLNYLFFPGISDTEEEFEALVNLVDKYKIDLIQLRNLNIDPELYLNCISSIKTPYMGLSNFMKRLKKQCPWIRFGYFNPFLEKN